MLDHIAFEAFSADSPGAGFFVKLRVRVAQAPRSTSQDHLMILFGCSAVCFAIIKLEFVFRGRENKCKIPPTDLRVLAVSLLESIPHSLLTVLLV